MGQFGSIIELLMPPASAGPAAPAAAADCNVAAPGVAACNSSRIDEPMMQAAAAGAVLPIHQVASEEWGSVVCRAAVWAGLVSVLLGWVLEMVAGIHGRLL
jgi:hypothetical protein